MENITNKSTTSYWEDDQDQEPDYDQKNQQAQ